MQLAIEHHRHIDRVKDAREDGVVVAQVHAGLEVVERESELEELLAVRDLLAEALDVRRHGEDGGVVLEVREAVAVEAEDRVPGQRAEGSPPTAVIARRGLVASPCQLRLNERSVARRASGVSGPRVRCESPRRLWQTLLPSCVR